MEASKVAQSLNGVSSLDDEAQLQQFQSLVDAIAPSSLTPELYRALFGVFERFPEHDGYGIFWSMVHLLEKCSRYESYLIESIRRRATQFNLLMINRLINGGFTKVGDVELVPLLTRVAEDPNALASARASAQSLLQYQRSHGQGA
jgi:hypothetical protein